MLEDTSRASDLGLELERVSGGAKVVHQHAFIQELLAKHDMTKCNPSRLSRSTSLLERLTCRPQMR